jgi:hypothetical protein
MTLTKSTTTRPGLVRHILITAALCAASAGLAACQPPAASHGHVYQPAPRACSNPALPSGDAAWRAGQEYVCTDGTWVRVTGYGN